MDTNPNQPIEIPRSPGYETLVLWSGAFIGFVALLWTELIGNFLLATIGLVAAIRRQYRETPAPEDTLSAAEDSAAERWWGSVILALLSVGFAASAIWSLPAMRIWGLQVTIAAFLIQTGIDDWRRLALTPSGRAILVLVTTTFVLHTVATILAILLSDLRYVQLTRAIHASSCAAGALVFATGRAVPTMEAGGSA